MAQPELCDGLRGFPIRVTGSIFSVRDDSK
jgi:hypothetical protein